MDVFSSNMPVFVKFQPANSILVRCDERDACGIVSLDGSSIYTLAGKNIGGGFDSEETAVIIPYAEYEELSLLEEQTDPEEDSPVIPEDVPEETILTRAELTRRITELEEQNALLQDCILEMSEAVYG